MTRAAYLEFLEARKLGVLGTVTPEGRPQGALVGYAVTAELDLVFDTFEDSRKYRNLMGNAAASFVVGWDGAETVQIDGKAEKLAGAALESYQAIYFKAWPDGVERLSWPGISYFLLRPQWVRYSDFSRHPPLIHETRLR